MSARLTSRCLLEVPANPHPQGDSRLRATGRSDFSMTHVAHRVVAPGFAAACARGTVAAIPPLQLVLAEETNRADTGEKPTGDRAVVASLRSRQTFSVANAKKAGERGSSGSHDSVGQKNLLVRDYPSDKSSRDVRYLFATLDSTASPHSPAGIYRALYVDMASAEGSSLLKNFPVCRGRMPILASPEGPPTSDLQRRYAFSETDTERCVQSEGEHTGSRRRQK